MIAGWLLIMVLATSICEPQGRPFMFIEASERLYATEAAGQEAARRLVTIDEHVNTLCQPVLTR